MSNNIFNKPIMFYVSLFLLLSILVYKPQKTQLHKETFSNFNFNFGEYPNSVNYPLLYGDYNLKKKNYGVVSTNDYSKNYEYYPINSSDSLKTNNIRYWKTPDNGKCSTADFCDVLYDETIRPGESYNNSELTSDMVINPPQPEWGISRVNYYESKPHMV